MASLAAESLPENENEGPNDIHAYRNATETNCREIVGRLRSAGEALAVINDDAGTTQNPGELRLSARQTAQQNLEAAVNLDRDKPQVSYRRIRALINALPQAVKDAIRGKKRPQRCETLLHCVYLCDDPSMRQDQLKFLITGLGVLNCPQQQQGHTPMHLFAEHGQTMMLRCILDIYPDNVLYRNGGGNETDGGNTPVLQAVRGGHRECVHLLLRYKAKRQLETVNRQKQTPLLAASLKGNDAIMRDILEFSTAEQGINLHDVVNVVDRNSWNALHHACKRGHLSCVELLLQYGIDRNALNNNDRSPLHYANDPAIIALLSNVH